VDDVGRLHSERGPAIAFPDGFALHVWHGVRVSAAVIEAPWSVTKMEALSITNVELRRFVIKQMGYDRYLEQSGARLLHRDDVGELYRMTFADDVPLVVVSVQNSTPEPDGSRRRYVLRVPPEMKTAREAVAWTFSLRAEDYRPDAES
jgi:hypothetical protein